MPDKYEPLTESYVYILLCLYNGPNHGYGIMQQTLDYSGGNVQIGSGTMYGAVSNMLKKGWIEECPAAGSGVERKRQYQLTSAGRQVLLEEAARRRRLSETIQRILEGNEHENK